MSVEYSLHPNQLTSDPDDFLATVQIKGSADQEQLIRRMLDQGSTVTEADLRAVLADLKKAIRGYLEDGFRVNLAGLAMFTPQIQGVFQGPADPFDSSRHRLTVKVTAGNIARHMLDGNVRVERVQFVKPQPQLEEFMDVISGLRNSKATPLGIAEMIGHRLKFNPAEADEGIFFIDPRGVESKVQIIQRNKPGQLVFQIPALAAGDYVLEVRVRISAGGDIRRGRLDVELTVS